MTEDYSINLNGEEVPRDEISFRSNQSTVPFLKGKKEKPKQMSCSGQKAHSERVRNRILKTK